MAKKKVQPSMAEMWIEEDNLELLECWARDGYSFGDIADRIGITIAMLQRWRDEYPCIKDALKRGRELTDYRVENALLKSALGYRTKEVKVITLIRFGKVIETTKEVLEKDQAPNVSAIQTWLFNRCPNKWKRNRDDILIDDEDTSIQVTVKRASSRGEEIENTEEEWQDKVNDSIEITRGAESESKETKTKKLNKDTITKKAISTQPDLDDWSDWVDEDGIDEDS